MKTLQKWYSCSSTSLDEWILSNCIRFLLLDRNSAAVLQKSDILRTVSKRSDQIFHVQNWSLGGWVDEQSCLTKIFKLNQIATPNSVLFYWTSDNQMPGRFQKIFWAFLSGSTEASLVDETQVWTVQNRTVNSVFCWLYEHEFDHVKIKNLMTLNSQKVTGDIIIIIA